MKQVNKLKNLENLSYFGKSAISQYIDIKPESLSVDINRWIKEGTLIQLKKGLYTTSNYFERVNDKSLYSEFIANKLRTPSYLSLEYMLQKYSILSEAVYSITSITAKAGRSYNNTIGLFLYRNIKESLFTGFNIMDYNDLKIAKATKAKALFDWLYLKFLRTQNVDIKKLELLRLNIDDFKSKDFKEFKSYCELADIKKYRILGQIITKLK
jgi:predicted transcriptional regulator of viral defense system